MPISHYVEKSNHITIEVRLPPNPWQAGEGYKMAGSIPGPICSLKCGPDWIDVGTTCRSKSEPMIPLGIYTKPSAGELAKQTILKILRNPAIARIKFKIDSFAVSPRSYAQVAGLIKDGRIRVEYNWGVGTSAYYYEIKNKIEVGFTAATSLTKRAQVVHECTHAAFDVHLYSKSTVATSEAAAFVAECLFARINSPKPDDPEYRLYDDKEEKDRIYRAAWKIAGKILSGKPPSADDYASLKAAVLKHPDYSHGRKLSGWDGV